MTKHKTTSIQTIITSQKTLSIIGITILLLLSIMFAKVQPEYLKASFFGRFFPKAVPTETTNESETTEPTPADELGFYKFGEIQTKYFPVPDTTELREADNYDQTPLTFGPFQQEFIHLWEEIIGSTDNPGVMIISQQNIHEIETQFQEIATLNNDIHAIQKDAIQPRIDKLCKKQDANKPCS